MAEQTTFNTAEFNQALFEYWVATKKDLAYVVNRQALNVAIKAFQHTPLATASSIIAVTKKPWWPKFVAKSIMSRRKGRRVKVGKKVFRLRSARDVKREGGVNYTRDQARQISAAIINARVKKIKFIAGGWIPAIKKLKQAKLRARFGGETVTDDAGIPIHKFVKTAYGNANVAFPGARPVATIINRTAASVKVGSFALQKAFDLAAKDMRKYIREKFLPTAKKFAPNSR